jgi:predicted secreted hydrolase
MNARLLALLLLLPGAALAQGFAGLADSADGFAPVTPPATLAFPRDHGPHPDFRIEWWYLTANLRGEDGADYGIQWTLFRSAMAPGADDAGWANGQVWMAHAAATSASDHRFAEAFARGGVGQAGVEPSPFRARIDGWSMTATGAPGDALAGLSLVAEGDGFAYDLTLAADRPPVPQGEAGFSVKSEAGQASYYYSQPFYSVTGTLTLDERELAVTGQGWLDREWSSAPLTADQEGWDWFALHLDGGAKLMVYRLRHRDAPAYLAGTYIAPDGTPAPLAPDQIVAEPRAEAEVAGRSVPVRWHVAVPNHGVAVDIEPLNAQSWMGTSYAYWEGPVRFTGSHRGVGYLELTGY